MDWGPYQAVERIDVKLGKHISIPPSGPYVPKNFNDDEKKRVTTFIDFELPFAIEGLQGEIPCFVEFEGGKKVQVILKTRQKHPKDIATSLRLAGLQPPRTGVIVGYGDRYGRINISAIQFKIAGFVDIQEGAQLFEDCLSWTNRFIEIYRRAKQDFTLRRITKDDIFAYLMAHLFDGNQFNEIIQPVADMSIQVLHDFPDDPMSKSLIWFHSQQPDELWIRLIDEAHHYLSLEDYRMAVVNSITALENVLKIAHGKNVKEFFERYEVPFSRWKDRESRKSITVCLNLFNLLCDEVHLERELTERILQYYALRNAIVHSGQMRVSAEKGRRCVADIYFLIRYLLDLIHLSVSLSLKLASLPAEDQFELFRMYSDEISLQIDCKGTLLTVTLETTDGTTTRLQADFSQAEWIIGERGTLLVTYDAHAKIAKLFFDTKEVDSAINCQHGYIDASLLRTEVRDKRHIDFLPIQLILQYAIVVDPNELKDFLNSFPHVLNLPTSGFQQPVN